MSRRVQLVVTAIVIVVLLALRCYQTPIPMSAVRDEFTRLPPPPGARLKTFTESRKSPTLFVHYDARLSKEEIGRHYTAVAVRAGWTSCGEIESRDWGRDRGDRSFMFIKGELGLAVSVPGDPKRYGYRYAVDMGHRQLWPWEDRGCR